MSDILNYLSQMMPPLIMRTGEQIYLVAAAMGLAIIIGIPLGISVFLYPRLKKGVLSVASVLQTIPSLALLAFLLPFLGIGVIPALIALGIYALLPIIRNTVTGLENVNPDIKMAADGLGFTKRQKLWLVEMPLSLPIIIAGIRTSTAMSVGIATLAAFIGAGGLGNFIYQGLVTNDNRLVLLGAIPAAILALLLDFFISRFERFSIYHIDRASKRSKKEPIGRRFFRHGFAIVILLFCVGIGIASFSMSGHQRDAIVVASKNSTEQIILAEMMAELIQDKTSLPVVRKFNLGSTQICHQAMLDGKIDIYPEYTGTAYLLILKQPLNRKLTPQALFQFVKTQYQTLYHVTWLTPFGFNDTNAVVVREDFAKTHDLNRISDLKNLAPQLIAVVRPSFYQRPDGYQILQAYYHLHFKKLMVISPGLLYQALKENKAEVIAGADSTSGYIIAFNLKVLEDGKHVFPGYYAAPLIRTKVLKNHPDILKALSPLAGLINNKTMQRLNAEVELEKVSPEKVAHEFLVKKGIIVSSSNYSHLH